MEPEGKWPSDGFDLHALEAWANKETLAKLIIDPDLALRWANNAARALLEAQQAAQVIQGKLAFRDPANQVSFQALIGQAPAGPAATCMNCGAPLGRIVVTAVLLPVESRSLLGVVLRLPQVATVPPGLLRSAFGLTKTECELIGFLLRGLMAEEAADHMQISVVTARTHIRNLYAKLDVSSREAMFSRLLPYLNAG